MEEMLSQPLLRGAHTARDLSQLMSSQPLSLSDYTVLSAGNQYDKRHTLAA
jgi:hypothetical protein